MKSFVSLQHSFLSQLLPCAQQLAGSSFRHCSTVIPPTLAAQVSQNDASDAALRPASRAAVPSSSSRIRFLNPSTGRRGTSRRGMCRWLAEQQRASSPPAINAPLSQAQQALLGSSQQGIQQIQSQSSQVRMESQTIFDQVWRRFETRCTLENVRVPREVIWLNGAPGAGKGVNTNHILKTRGLDTSISMSQLLVTNPESKARIDRGDMLPDTLVLELLLDALLTRACNAPECGVLIDGFPRTALQVDFLKLLHDKLIELHALWANTRHECQFPRPLFKVVMLYVDEETSIKRQMERARLCYKHNKRVVDAGAGELWEQRATDLSVTKCKKRYDIFKAHYDATMRLKQFFPFHLIDAMGELEETQEAISLELRYQSSLDLSSQTYAHIRHLPLSRDLAQHARQQLVSRLDDHSQKYPHLFQMVIDLITSDIMPRLRESGMAGRAEYVSDTRMFSDHPRAAQMLIDVLTDRGFSVSHCSEVSNVPVSFDLQTGQIKHRQDTRHRFTIHWETEGVRNISSALEIATRMAETAAREPRISQSFIPQLSAGLAAALHHQQELTPAALAEIEDQAQAIHGS